MLARSFCRTLILVLCTVLMLAAFAAGASTLSADKYLATRKALAAVPDLSSVKLNPSSAIGKTIELIGKITGTMKTGDDLMLLVTSGNDSYVIKAKNRISDMLLGGDTVRLLVKVGPQSTASLSDLSLEAIALDYEVANREKELASKPKSAPNALYRGSDPTKFYSARYSHPGLSSRAMQVYDPYYSAISKFNPRLTPQQVATITTSILGYSEQYGVDPRLIIALIIAESNFKPTAISRCGAMGLCQLMPGTARGMGVSNAFDPEQNIAASVKLMRSHLDEFGSLALALSAYNAGVGAVKRHGGVPPYRETRNYIAKVTRIYKALCGK